jgi:hypothetical protein
VGPTVSIQATRPSVQSTAAATAGKIIVVNVIHDTIAGWIISARWPARRRLRFRLGLVLFAVGLRRLAVRVSGV